MRATSGRSRGATGIGLAILMPRSASSSAVPIMAVQSPGCTGTSRPGQAITSPGLCAASERMMATGARSPYISRSVDSSVANAPDTTKSMPATVMVWVVSSSSASTTDGAARSATSRIARARFRLPSPRAAPCWRAGRPPAPGVGLPGQQRDLEVQRVVVGDADNRVGHRDTRGLQALGDCSGTTLSSALFSSSMMRTASASSRRRWCGRAWETLLRNPSRRRVTTKVCRARHRSGSSLCPGGTGSASSPLAPRVKSAKSKPGTTTQLTSAGSASRGRACCQ